MSDETVQSFQNYVASERERLSDARSRVLNQRAEADAWLAEIDREFAAIEAYEAAKRGKSTAARPRATETRPRRAGLRDAITQVLSAAPLGMKRAEILEALGVRGDKSGENSVSNALTTMQRDGRVIRQENGHWAVVATPLHEAA